MDAVKAAPNAVTTASIAGTTALNAGYNGIHCRIWGKRSPYYGIECRTIFRRQMSRAIRPPGSTDNQMWTFDNKKRLPDGR
jgi:hypothetical protein